MPRGRGGRRLAGRAHDAPGRRGGGSPRRPARGPGVRQQLRLGVDPTPPSRAARGRCSSPRCRTSRSSFLPVARRAARARPRARGVGPRAGPRPVARFAGPCCRSCARPSWAACCWSALHLLAEFGALQMLRFPTFTTADPRAVRVGLRRARPATCSPACWCCCAWLLLGRGAAAAGRARATRGSGRARRRRAAPVRARPVDARSPSAAWRALVALALGVPLGRLVRWLAGGGSTAGPLGELVASPASPTLALGGSGCRADRRWRRPPGRLARRRQPGRRRPLVERATYVASSLPGVVVALALVTAVGPLRPPGSTRPSALLVAAYAILFLPRAMVSIRSAMAQAPPELDDAARALGARPWRAFARVLAAADRARPAGRVRDGLPRRRHRADRHPAARPDRHRDAGHAFWSRAATPLDYGAPRPTPR